MKKGWIFTVSIVLVVAVLGMVACSVPPAQSDFNLIFRYGVGAKNELNTFEGTYTRDMIGDPSVTVDLSLTEEELDKIHQKMVEIAFFDYPEEYSVNVAPGEPAGIIIPYSSYYFKIEDDSGIKELWWEAKIININENEKADRLRELIKLIWDIIESKEEYQKLPEPTGGYM
ncbi:MAG: hypothetical protein V3R96_01030 [Dehalococcoidales bacterium]